jgi:hypothetical protein
MLAGCSFSALGGSDEPATTGSIAGPVEVQGPLPPTLAYSDASKIGQAAAATLWQAEGGASGDWINAATGSSGTVEEDSADTTAAGECRPFSTIVTSIGGVHSYSGDICRSGVGSVLRFEGEQAASAPRSSG